MEQINPESLASHTTGGDCWVAIDGKVYNVTAFLSQHPGGKKAILDLAGTDCTQTFNIVGHSDFARDRLAEFCVGDLGTSTKHVEVKTEKDNSIVPFKTTVAAHWHKVRRDKILEDHPEVRELMKPNEWTLLVAALACMGHLLAAIYCQTTSWIMVIGLSATWGATCKMFQFMCNHEFVHGTAGEWANRIWPQRIILALAHLPSFGNFLFYYVALLHLGHHASLGRYANTYEYTPDQMKEMNEFYRNTVPGGLKIDGDKGTPNFLRFFLFRSPQKNFMARLFFHSASIVVFQVIFFALELGYLVQWTIYLIPIVLCYLWAPLLVFQIASVVFGVLWLKYLHSIKDHWSLAPALQSVFWMTLMYFTLTMPSEFLEPALGMAKGSLIFTPGYAILYYALADMFFHGFLMHPYGGFFMTVHASDPNAKKLPKLGQDEENASSSSSRSPSSQTDSKQEPSLDDDDLGVEMSQDLSNSRSFGDKEVQYSALSTQTAHNDDDDDDDDDDNTSLLDSSSLKNSGSEDDSDDRKVCQPTYSCYSDIASFFTGNLTYHVEHHDFPNIPWNKLPQLREIAPEYYNTLDYQTSLFWPVWDGLWNGSKYSYSCFD